MATVARPTADPELIGAVLEEQHLLTPSSKHAAMLGHAASGGGGDEEEEEDEEEVRALRGGMYREAMSALVSNLVLAVGLAMNLAGNLQQLRHAYFLHMIVLLVASFIAIVALKNAIVTWQRTGDRTLQLLWYSFVLRYIQIWFTIVSLTVAQTVVQKVQQYLNPVTVTSVSFASRFLSFIALSSFALTTLDYALQEPARRQRASGDKEAPGGELGALRRRIEALERGRR